MEAIRKIIDHSTHEVVIELPESYQNKKLEVIVLVVEEETGTENMITRNFTEHLIGKVML